jgi:hypothetical protein
MCQEASKKFRYLKKDHKAESGNNSTNRFIEFLDSLAYYCISFNAYKTEVLKTKVQEILTER